MKPEVSATVGGAGKLSDGLHRIHWKQIDSDGISGSLVGHMMKPECEQQLEEGWKVVRWTPLDPFETKRFRWNLLKSSREHEPIQARYTRNVITRS